MNKKIILFLLAIFSFLVVGYSADWKDQHNKADTLSLAQAQKTQTDKYVLGLVYLNLHQDQLAYEVFDKILLGQPDNYAAKWGKAEALRRKHDLVPAESLLNEVLKIDPQFSPALISLAYIKYFQMDFNLSVRLALKVIQQGQSQVDLSNYVRALAMYAGAKGMLAHYGGLFSKAIDGTAVKPNLDKALKLQPNSPAALFGVGSFYLLAPRIAGGDKSKAESYFNQAIAVDPYFADVYVRFAQLAKIKGDKEKYDLYMQKALALDPQNELALDTLSGRCKFICVGGEE
ncbi:MAG: tetratricopeptide repeat protein [Candidatus Omnitrophota bacterium]